MDGLLLNEEGKLLTMLLGLPEPPPDDHAVRYPVMSEDFDAKLSPAPSEPTPDIADFEWVELSCARVGGAMAPGGERYATYQVTSRRIVRGP